MAIQAVLPPRAAAWDKRATAEWTRGLSQRERGELAQALSLACPNPASVCDPILASTLAQVVGEVLPESHEYFVTGLMDRSGRTAYEWHFAVFCHIDPWVVEKRDPEYLTQLEAVLVDYVAKRNANVIVRGLRAVSDFEFEFQMGLMNRRLNGSIETVFMMPAEQYTYISSRLIKEVFTLGGQVQGLVPDMVEARLREKVAAQVTK